MGVKKARKVDSEHWNTKEGPRNERKARAFSVDFTNYWISQITKKCVEKIYPIRLSNFDIYR